MRSPGLSKLQVFTRMVGVQLTTLVTLIVLDVADLKK